MRPSQWSETESSPSQIIGESETRPSPTALYLWVDVAHGSVEVAGGRGGHQAVVAHGGVQVAGRGGGNHAFQLADAAVVVLSVLLAGDVTTAAVRHRGVHCRLDERHTHTHTLVTIQQNLD